MKFPSVFRRRACIVALAATALVPSLASAQLSAPTPASAAALAEALGDSLHFGGVVYQHRWSKNGENDYTPAPEPDLTAWHDMLTIDVNPKILKPEELVAAANSVLTRYHSEGQVLRTTTRPATADRPAEELVVAVLNGSGFLQATFARFVLTPQGGEVIVASHRIYGTQPSPAMNRWLQARGGETERELMDWTGAPTIAALQTMPQDP